MATSIELATTRVNIKTGVVNATVVDKLSPDRLVLMLFRGSLAAIYRNTVDGSASVGRGVKDLVVFPFSDI